MPKTISRRTKRPCATGIVALSLVASCAAPIDPDPIRTPTAMHRSAAAESIEVRGRVIDRATGHPVAAGSPIVVVAIPDGRTVAPANGTTRLPRTDGTFAPSFLVVPVGERVVFENREAICHRFFSSAPENAFDLGLLEPNRSRVVRFERPGRVHVYCSLHADRQATILVAPTPWFATVGPRGEFSIGGLHPGPYVFEVRSETRRATRREVLVPDTGPFVVDLSVDGSEESAAE